jgi:predicted dehydrogenase
MKNVSRATRAGDGTAIGFAPAEVEYNFEFDRRIRAGFIGAGGHAYRNVYPTFQYAPVDLVCVCDLNDERASKYSRLFGAERHYTDHHEMLAQERLDAVFIVTAYWPDGRVQATDLALDALAAGVHVWMEKPTAASVAEVKGLMRASEESGKHVMTGLKKIFTPAMEHVKRVIESPGFGRPRSIFLRYPQALPPLAERESLPQMRSFLDHIFHPGSVLHYLFGPIHRLTYEWEPFSGGTVTSIRFANEAVGQLHLAAGASGTSPLERLEVIGDGANILVENGVVVTYYRRAPMPAYGRALSYVVPEDIAPLRWEPEFSLGQVCNKNLFYLGYVSEVLHFCEAVLTARPPTKGTLADSLEIAKLFEAYRRTPPGVPVVVNDV